ncbi:plasmid mobilization protein [Parabacteroides distasonis]|uniref:plasmid mobilization protein n=1 Tax=Parabacteroides distasonis TaxID=823 RepID=UPI0018A0130D|nr:plasmid mobilization relaxosome protein MobC [Parabacteroides distasonis]MDB9153513.1 plasmid mobilization relaxosome protein MobC [Parabacteroides distasonis]MDB9158085.1 plasmid mobilization relaxosome protein MobC [Parabacteroides distasonis]MDB9166899.1 plasmid mobilization relaxosome protein MobC [Parabacteroides distasonis]MDB9171369.1 plasmid mobilization relaxosome protein MobC [Parabacteroides distasonis]MDB9192796.1 plasmid mobilization relaxosome protein MobC [Parabacteroides dis
MSNKDKIKPRGRPKASGIRKLSKSVTVKFSRIDYERLLHRSRQANRSLAEFLRESAFNAQIVARHSIEETTVMRNLVGMANNLNQLTKLSHQTGFYRTKNVVMELLEKLKVIMNEYKIVERRKT